MSTIALARISTISCRVAKALLITLGSGARYVQAVNVLPTAIVAASRVEQGVKNDADELHIRLDGSLSPA